MLSADSFGRFSDEDIEKARGANLSMVLRRYHPDMITIDSDGIVKLVDIPYLKIIGSGYKSYLDGSKGNAIDLLVKYLDYTFPDAVRVLIGKGSVYPIRHYHDEDEFY